MRTRTLTLVAALALLALVGACVGCGPRGRAPQPPAAADSLATLERDAPERLSLPLSPAGSGELVLERTRQERAELPPPVTVAPSAPAEIAPALPGAEPATPPEGAPDHTRAVGEDPALKPPIPRGLPVLPRGGRGGRVALDVRVDEHGEVTDAELVETDADSATVAAAIDAAYSLRFYPAILGERRVAVWTRQLFQVKRAR